MRALDANSTAGREDPMKLTHHVRELPDMLEDVNALDVVERLVVERERVILEVVDHVNAVERGNIEIDPAWPDVAAATEVQLPARRHRRRRLSLPPIMHERRW